jgi:hypothetical protein
LYISKKKKAMELEELKRDNNIIRMDQFIQYPSKEKFQQFYINFKVKHLLP